MNNGFSNEIKYEIYIGLKDQLTYEENINAQMFCEFLESYCFENKINFSIHIIKGGYEHNLGYVTETSLIITLIGLSYDKVLNIVNKAKEFVNTDTVMITKEEIETLLI